MRVNNHPNLKVKDPVYQAAMQLVDGYAGFRMMRSEDIRFLPPGFKELTTALFNRGMILDNETETTSVN